MLALAWFLRAAVLLLAAAAVWLAFGALHLALTPVDALDGAIIRSAEIRVIASLALAAAALPLVLLANGLTSLPPARRGNG